MLAGILITIREGLEAFLVVGILLGYLTKLNQQKYSKYVWVGSSVGILSSALIACLFQTLKIEFEGVAADIFEVIVAAIAVAVLSYMIVWMQKQSKISREIYKLILPYQKISYGELLFWRLLRLLEKELKQPYSSQL